MITVLIRISDDYRVLKCIDSIRKTSLSSQIIVSMTPNKFLEKIIKELGIRYCIVPKKNVSVTTNRGLELVKTPKVIVTDCDTIFDKNCINKLDKALDRYDVVKPKLIFQTKKGFFNKSVANLRTYFNNGPKMYMPGLSFRLNIKTRIGNHFFDENVAWSEDSEFSNRIEKVNLITHYVKSAQLFHPPLNISHDLADSFLIGAKKYKRQRLGELIQKRIKKYKQIFTLFGLSTTIYGIIWYLFFDLGQMSKGLGPIGIGLQDMAWAIITKKKNK